MKEINHSKIKETNRKKIISLLLEKNEITKLDISRELDISITTVSTNINELKELDIVEDVRSMESTGGRKAISIRLKENCRFSIGVALTPKHIKISLINLKREVIDDVKIRHNNSGMDEVISIINENILEVLKRNNVENEKLLGIGVSIPGIVDIEEGIIKNCYFLGANNFNIEEKLKSYNVPIFVKNEANLSAYYEFLNRKDIVENLLYVSITDGLGLGIIINGNIYEGCNNAAGEFGHTKIQLKGKKCQCGREGCLEAYTSKNTLVEDYNLKSNIKIEDIEAFEEKYLNGDEIAKEQLEGYLEFLAMGVSNLIMLLDPSTIVIGGDINNLLSNKIDMLKELIYEDNSFRNEKNCDITVANFKESYLLGAALVPIEEFLSIK